MRRRLAFLVMTIAIAVVAVACGRASQNQIDAALGITPTVTLSAADMATGTSQAVITLATRQAAIASLASPGSGGSPVSFAAAGDIVQGRTQFMIRCQQCHQPSGAGRAPALKGPNNPAVALTDEGLRELVRSGVGHAAPPGPLNEVAISDRQLINIIAYIRDQST